MMWSRPRAASMTISTTRRCSSWLKVGDSPVVPHGTMPSVPWATCISTSCFSLASSTLPSVKGVTSATMEPWNMGRIVKPSMARAVRERKSFHSSTQAGNTSSVLAAQVRERFGTPCYVYDRSALEAAAREALAFPAPHGLTVRYAMKANPSHGILTLFRDLGLDVDASSDFEV